MAYVHLTSITRDICTCSLIYSETVINLFNIFGRTSTVSVALQYCRYVDNSSERRIQKILTARKTEGVLLTYTLPSYA